MECLPANVPGKLFWSRKYRSPGTGCLVGTDKGAEAGECVGPKGGGVLAEVYSKDGNGTF